MAITDWPEDERPRERLMAQGAAALSDAELLAIFLRVGIPGKSAVDLARELIRHFGSLTNLFAASLDAFSAIPGMGPAKYAQLQAVLEMSKRALSEEMIRSMAARPIMTPSQPVWSIMAFAFSGLSTSPLPMTGIFTASFTCAMMSQSACPL